MRWMAAGRARVVGRARLFFSDLRAAEMRLLPRPFRQAMEWRQRALARKESSWDGASAAEVPCRAVWAVAQSRWKMRVLGWVAPVISDRATMATWPLPRAEA